MLLLLFSCSVVSDSATLWTTACQASLSFTISWNLLKLCSLNQWCYPTISPSVILFCLQSFLASGSFPMNRLFTSGGQSIGASASASVLPMNIQDWFSFRFPGLNSLQTKELKSLLHYHNSKASVLWHSAFLMFQLLHSYITIGKTIALIIGTFVDKVISLLFNMLSKFVIAFLPRSKRLLI